MSRPSDLFSRWREAHGLIGTLAPGRYVQTEYGWGMIVYVGHGSVVISVFAFREDPGKQDFPEYEVIHRPPPNNGVDAHPPVDSGEDKFRSWPHPKARLW